MSYHPFKANVVGYVIRRLSIGSVEHDVEKRRELVKDVHRLDLLSWPYGHIGQWCNSSI